MNNRLEQAVAALLKQGPDPEASDDLGPWRDRIDLMDRLILLLLNERAASANQIGHIKKKLNMPVYVPSREDEVIRNVRAANQGPLPDHAVQHLFERIIDETRSLERQKYQDEPETPTGRSED